MTPASTRRREQTTLAETVCPVFFDQALSFAAEVEHFAQGGCDQPVGLVVNLAVRFRRFAVLFGRKPVLDADEESAPTGHALHLLQIPSDRFGRSKVGGGLTGILDRERRVVHAQKAWPIRGASDGDESGQRAAISVSAHARRRRR